MSLLQHLNAELSIKSGQEFLWERIDNSWYGIHGSSIVRFPVGEPLKLESSTGDITAYDVFRLDDDFDKIIKEISRDSLVREILSNYTGLRLMRQDPEQCLFSFLCASNTNIPMIRKMLHSLCSKLGSPIQFDGYKFYTFPSAKVLNEVSEADLRSLGLGYRAKAIKSAAKEISQGTLNLESLKKASYEDARARLLEIYGVGPKIADCVLLFSLEKLEAFPIDVWIARALSGYYGWLYGKKTDCKLTPRQYDELSRQTRCYFGRKAGYAQQYIYYHMRQEAGKMW